MQISRSMVVGGLAGIALVMTSSWLITGFAFHRFQKFTPATWRTESWRQHARAVAWAALGGVALGALEYRVTWIHLSLWNTIQFAILAWAALAGPVIATMATYINLHRAVVFGILLEWLILAIGVSLACYWWAT